MTEEWRPLKEFDGSYEVSSFGRVRSLDRMIADGRPGVALKRLLRGRIMATTPNNHGYLCVYICKDGKKYCKRVHRLVAEAFIPNPENLPQINHKDENKKNNKVDNLEWCTAEYNMNYGTLPKKLSKRKSKRCMAIYPDGAAIVFNSVKEAAEAFHTSFGNICAACRGERKYSHGLRWVYLKDKGESA